MQQHLEQVLTAAGLPPETVKTLVELPADHKDFKPEDHVVPIRTNVETMVKNDPKFYEGLNKENLPKEFYQKLEAEQYGRSVNVAKSNLIKAAGLSDKDFADLGEDGKKLEVFTPAFIKKLTSGKVGSEELQAKLIEANQKIQAMETERPELEKTFETKYQGIAAIEKQGFVVLATLATIQGLKVPPDYIAEKITAELRDKYHIGIKGVSGVIRQKDKTDLAVLTDNGTKELTLNGAIQAILVRDGLLEDPEKKTKTEDGKTKVDVTPEEGKLKINSHVDKKLKARLEADKKTSGK